MLSKNDPPGWCRLRWPRCSSRLREGCLAGIWRAPRGSRTRSWTSSATFPLVVGPYTPMAWTKYEQLEAYVEQRGGELANTLGISLTDLTHLCRCVLDEMLRRGALSREMLRYHPSYPACPPSVKAADWERRVRSPRGFAADDAGQAVPFRDSATIPAGISVYNLWKRQGVGGRAPRLETIFRHLLLRFGGIAPHDVDLLAVLAFLQQGSFIALTELYGYGPRSLIRLLQVNSERIVLAIADAGRRMHCNVCSATFSGSIRNLPCPRCHGSLVPWTEEEVGGSRTVQRIRNQAVIPLVAREHTAQVPTDERAEIEGFFKAPEAESYAYGQAHG